MISAAVLSSNPPEAVGARIDEGAVRATVVVDPKGSVRTLGEGFAQAYQSVRKGIPTRLLIRPGTYREAVLGLDWSKGKAADTLLVVEGRGKVVWTGADVFPLGSWAKVGPLYRHPWPYRWGNFAYSWSAKGLIGHRSEMVFVDGEPLMPRILERYETEGIVQDPAKPGEVGYRFLGRRDPDAVLGPGEFGVVERPEDEPALFLRPKENLAPNAIEVSVRRNLLDLRGKGRVVLRNVAFTGAANDDADFGADNAIRFAIAGDRRSHDVLIDRCKVLWSAQTGLHIDGDRWTIRDSEFSFKGGSGVASGKFRTSCGRGT